MTQYRRRPGVVYTQICGEHVLIATGSARDACAAATRINAAAAAYWQALEQPRTLQTLGQAVKEKSGGELRPTPLHTLSFLTRFVSAGFLLAESDGEGEAETPPAAQKTTEEKQ